MSLFKKIFLFVSGVLVLGLAGVYFFLFFFGRALFNERVSALTQRKVTVESIMPSFPAGLELTGLEVEGLFKARRLAARVEVAPLLRHELVIGAVVVEDPVLYLVRREDSTLDLPSFGGQDPGAIPAVSSTPAAVTTGTMKSAPAPLQPIVINKVVVRSGEFHLKDLKAKREWVVDRIDADIAHLPLGLLDVRTDFTVTAGLSKLNMPFIGGFAKAHGWVNWFAKDMDVSLQCVDDNGHEGFSLVLSSKANDLGVTGKLDMIGKQQKQADGKKSRMLENAVLGLLDAGGIQLATDFSFHTKMDRFEVTTISLNGSANKSRDKSGLHSGGTSGNIVDTLKSFGSDLLKDTPATGSSK